MDLKKIEQGIRLVLEGMGENPERDGLKDTPRRVADMCQEIFGGMGHKFTRDIGFTEDINSDSIEIKNISFYSVCEHHLLPFFGKVNISYWPRDNKVAGFSSIARIVDNYSRRLQIQERLTGQIADEIMRFLKPVRVKVIVEAVQLCASMRGNHKKDIQTVTEAVRGKMPQGT